MRKSRIAAYVISMFFLLFLTLYPKNDVYGYDNSGLTSHKVTAVVRIDKINNLTKNVVQGAIFKFPATINALMSNGQIVSQKVVWSITKLSTAKVVSYSVTGKVKGYVDKIKMTVKVIPKTPTLLSAKKSYTGWIKLTWNVVKGASGYNLYYSNDEESWEKWNSTVTKNSAMLSGVENGVELYFRVASVTNGIESFKSPSVYFTMLSKHLPQYPNLPVHPDFSVDKTNGSFQGTDGIYYYRYSTSRVGTDFAETYYEKILKREDFIYDPKKIVKAEETGVSSKYGEYSQETTDSFFTSADETYVVRRIVVNGLLDGNAIKEDYFLVFRK